MDDPTISLGDVSGAIEYIKKQIEAGEDVKKIVKDFKKSVFEARLKSAERPSFFVMTINMKGPSVGWGTAEKRRDLLRVILHLFPSAIIFCQELPGVFESLLPDGCEARRNGGQAAVIWTEKNFESSVQGLKTTDRKIREIYEKLLITNAGSGELLSRISMVKLTTMQGKSTLAVSYHGQYNVGAAARRKTFQILLKFLSIVIESMGISSYIIGGDFNFDTLDADISKNVMIPSYELSNRLEKSSGIPYKDNFVYYPKTILEVSWVRFFDFEVEESTESDLTEDDWEKVQDAMKKGARESEATEVLDHDPIVGVLVFKDSAEIPVDEKPKDPGSSKVTDESDENFAEGVMQLSHKVKHLSMD